MGAPPPAPPFVTPEIVSSSERPFTTSPDTIPSASPPRPPSVRSSASPPRPPCIVVTQFEEKLGETNTPAIPAGAHLPPRSRPGRLERGSPSRAASTPWTGSPPPPPPPPPPCRSAAPPFPPGPPLPPTTLSTVFVDNQLVPVELATSMATAVPASPPRPPAVVVALPPPAPPDPPVTDVIVFHWIVASGLATTTIPTAGPPLPPRPPAPPVLAWPSPPRPPLMTSTVFAVIEAEGAPET